MGGLKAICRSRGLTQEAMAARFQVSLSTWQRYEACTSDPSPKMRETIADFLGVTLDQLAGRHPVDVDVA